MKIYNNTDHMLYADGVALMESKFVTTQKFDYTPDIMSTHMTVQAVYVIPGSGTDHPVAPGESFILCDTGIDHRIANPNSFDLSRADYEWYDESSVPAHLDIDSPTVPNLDKWYCYTKSFWVLHNRGFRGFAIARIPIEKEKFLTENLYTYSYVMVLPAGTFPMEQTAYKVPNEWIIDAVNTSVQSEYVWNVTLSTRNIRTKDFSWNTDFIFSYAKNEVTRLKGLTSMMELVSGNGFAREGYPVRGLFSIPFAGLDEDGIPQYLIDGKVTSTSINFQEREKLDYLKYEGPTDPTVTGSFGNVFTYKGFKLNVFMTYSFGNVVRLNPVFNYKYSDLTAMPREFKNRWTVSGDEARTNIPVILSDPQYRANTSLYLAYNAYNYSTERIAKGDFIRMKEISLMYEFPRSWIAPAKISNLSLKLQATNLFLIYADKKLNGQDPEFVNTGGVASPVPRQFTLTLRLGL